MFIIWISTQLHNFKLASFNVDVINLKAYQKRFISTLLPHCVIRYIIHGDNLFVSTIILKMVHGVNRCTSYEWLTTEQMAQIDVQCHKAKLILVHYLIYCIHGVATSLMNIFFEKDITWWRHRMETFVFRVTGPLCGEFTGHRWIPLTKASDAELWCFLWSPPEPTVKQTIDTPVIWGNIALIMTSL